ncbi:MAG: MFS transporter, partial [Terriglobia bacterium]
LVVAPFLLLFWIIGQFDKANISLVIADRSFQEELALVGRQTALGGLMSVFFFGYGAAIFVWGFLVDRFGPRVCLMVGSAGWGAAMFLMSQATSLEGLLLARFLLGVAEGNMWPVSNALTNRWFPAREHSRAQAFWLTGATSGTAIAIPVVTALMLASGWRGMMVALAVLSLVPIVLFAFVANRPAAQKRLDPRELEEIESDRKKVLAVGRLSFRELLQSRSFWLITGGMTVSTTTVFTLIQWIPSFIVSQRQLPFQTMSNWITVGYVLATVVMVLAGSIADRTMQRARTAAWTGVLMAVLMIPGALLLSPRASAVFLAAMIGAGAVSAALNGALMHAMVRPEAIARGTGIYTGVGTFISALGPALFGRLIQALDGAYWGGFLFLALINLASATCYFALHRISARVPEAAASGLSPLPATSGSRPGGLPVPEP